MMPPVFEYAFFKLDFAKRFSRFFCVKIYRKAHKAGGIKNTMQGKPALKSTSLCT
jgi:hypothetical protein